MSFEQTLLLQVVDQIVLLEDNLSNNGESNQPYFSIIDVRLSRSECNPFVQIDGSSREFAHQLSTAGAQERNVQDIEDQWTSFLVELAPLDSTSSQHLS